MRITVNPDVQGAGDFPVWAEGVYELEVSDLQEVTNSKGNPMLVVQLSPLGVVTSVEGQVLERPGKLFDRINVDPVTTKTGQKLSFLRPFVESCGLTWGDFDTEQLRGAKCRARVMVGEYQGKTRNEVGRYVKAS